MWRGALRTSIVQIIDDNKNPRIYDGRIEPYIKTAHTHTHKRIIASNYKPIN